MRQEKTMEEHDIEKLREVLLQKREEIIGGVRQLYASSQEVGQDGIQDMADEASNLYTQQILMSLNENQRKQLREVDEALDRIGEGTYGVCEHCGKTIGIKRLQIRPFAKYCVQCQDMMEKLASATPKE